MTSSLSHTVYFPRELADYHEDESLKSKVFGLRGQKAFFSKSDLGTPRSMLADGDRVYALLTSRKLGDSVLGSGTSKTVKLAYNMLSGEYVATYRLSDKFLSELSLRDEFRGLNGIQPPPVAIAAYESKKGPSQRVIESLYSADLEHVIAKKDLPTERKMALSSQLLSGLCGIHERGYLHRDIKPANILFKEEGEGAIAHIADFGLCVKQEDKAAQMIQQGSPKFFSPEYVDYALKTPEQPAEFHALEVKKKEIEARLCTLVEPPLAAFSEYRLKKWLSANAGHAEAHDLYRQLVEAREAKSQLRVVKDFSNVTSQKHDIYAMGLVLYGLFTSQADLDTLISLRNGKDEEPRFDDKTPEAMQELIKGMLMYAPSERWDWDRIKSTGLV